MITYRIEFSRPGQLPFAVAHQRTGGRYGPTELVPLGGSLEILAGNLCGTGELTLNRVPERGGYRLRPLDRVQVFFSDSPEPVYLGEVICDPRPEKEGGLVHLKLQGLWERVKLAAWSCDTDAQGAVQPLKLPFREYILAVLSRARADLPPGVTIGAIPEVNATLRAVTIHELLGDTFQALLPVTQGGSVGVTARGELTVTLPDDTRRHRFIRTKSERPPGEVGEYRNAIRFPYKKPDGTDAYFVYRYGLDIAEHGASWLSDGLPSNVTATLVNPYAAEDTPLSVTLTHPGGGTVTRRAVAHFATPDAPALGTLMNLDPAVVWGQRMVMRNVGQEQVVFRSTYIPDGLPDPAPLPQGDVWVVTPMPRLEVIREGRDGELLSKTVLSEKRPDGKQNSAFAFSFKESDPETRTLTLRYPIEDVLDYFQANNVLPPGMDITGRNLDYPQHFSVAGWFMAAVNPEYALSYTGPISPDLPTTESILEAPWIVPPFAVPARVRISLDRVRRWRGQDVVTTNSEVTGAEATDLTVRPPRSITLERIEDERDTGRRQWRVPKDAELSDILLTGNLGAITGIGINLSDEAGLTAYAVGKLLSLVNPVLSWKGKYDVLRRLDVRGTVAFDDEQGDVELDIVRGVYDLTGGRCVVEAGTKQALDDSQALSRAFEGIERVQRLQQRPAAGGQT